MKITLDSDEREVVNCLIENTLIRTRIMKYALGHGMDLYHGQTFEYNKATGEVTSPAPDLEIEAG